MVISSHGQVSTNRLFENIWNPASPLQKVISTKREKKIQSTSIPSPDTTLDFFPPSDSQNEKTNDICAAIVPFHTKATAYADLTGKFPY